MMKLFYLLSFFFLFEFAFAQPIPPGHAHANKKNTWEEYNAKYNNPIYVIDGKQLDDSLAKKKLIGLDPGDIIKIVKTEGKSHEYRTLVNLNTATDKVNSYKKKFSEFSAGYKSYLLAHRNIDGFLIYVIGRTPLSGSRSHVIDTLYNIPVDKIASVDFLNMMDSTGERANNSGGTVMITLKN